MDPEDAKKIDWSKVKKEFDPKRDIADSTSNTGTAKGALTGEDDPVYRMLTGKKKKGS